MAERLPISCFLCGSHAVTSEDTYDHFCSHSEVKYCTCNDCGMEWHSTMDTPAGEE